jgi:DNA-directed RNA polymerase
MVSLVEKQKQIESLMIEEAINRQARENDKADKRLESGDTKAGKYYVKAITNQLIESIEVFLNPEKKVGRKQFSAKVLKELDIEPATIAFLTTKAIVNLMSVYKKKSVNRVTLCRAIGDMIHDEWRLRVFGDTKYRKALLKKLFNDFDKRAYPREWRRRTIKNYFDAEALSWEGWTPKEKTRIGHDLLVLFREVTGFLDQSEDGSRISPSAAFQEHAKRLMGRQVSSFILYRPMVVPPHDWTTSNLFRGGYISDKVKPYAIVKGSSKRDLLRFTNMDWSEVLPAVNALQRTAWRVNTIMVEALDWTYSVYMDRNPDIRYVGKLVSPNPKSLPPVPDGYNEDEEITKKHNRICFLIRDRNRQDIGKRMVATMAIRLAKEFVEYDRIFFPHNLDSRGRAYPLPAVLNPQGADFVKAMLEFAEGVPVMDQEQADWIAITGANAYGNDKVSLAERVQWVHDNEEMILSIAQDYQSDLRWAHASEPFQFLRFCFEWAGFKAQGFGFMSCMVAPVDATCSGLQHYAAMLRDEIGGKSVNLVPGMSRQDIYGDVATVVIRKLVQDRHSQEELGEDLTITVGQAAADWLAFGIDRKITKRQVMVVPYAGTFSSCMKYTRDAVAEKLEDGHAINWDMADDGEHNARVVYLSKLVWQAIDEVVVKGKEGMRWLTKVASDFAKFVNKVSTDTPYARRMTWLTPDGFEVCHYREDEKKTRLTTFFDGRIQLVMYEGTGYLSSKDMGTAVAPNFVHALDATHLRMAVMRGIRRGITQFGMVHDSFGTHAANMPTFLKECIRPAFVQMYTEHDVLQEFADRFKMIGEIAPVPEKGSLDLNGVLNCEFVFS